MSETTPSTNPNILLIMVDQMRFPRFDYGAEHGFLDPIKQIFGFQGAPDADNDFKQYFPGLWALRNNAVCLNNHRIASAACVPSRTALFTGQYGTRTGVLQTDGLFKAGADPKFPWLPQMTFPTIGNYLRKHNYTTHYFGKWHVSGEETQDLDVYGFADWEQSYPDPHGSLPNNLGHYRDYQFQGAVCNFFRNQGLGLTFDRQHAQANVEGVDGPAPSDPATPWFAVASFTNPHDIASYPVLPSYVYNSKVDGAPYTLAVPPQNADSAKAFVGTYSFKLNVSGFPQDNANPPLTWDEPLDSNNKPDCHLDYRYKMGLSLASLGGRYGAEQLAETDAGQDLNKQQLFDFAVDLTLDTDKMGLPFALTDNPELASSAFIQYYGYLISEVDQHVSKALQALEESGQADNTIVIFCPDHGECSGAHGNMMEKWHTAYEEVIHVPMVVRFPPGLHQVPGGLAQIDEATSHIDILPTVLGFAGLQQQDIQALMAQLQADGFSHVLPPVGCDLSGLIKGEQDHATHPITGEARQGVLFMTHDTITEPLEGALKDNVSDIIAGDESIGLQGYHVYLGAVERLRQSDAPDLPEDANKISWGSVCQPNHLHAVIDNNNWKLVRYFDPAGQTPEQYELYDLNNDTTEQYNLLQYNGVFPTPMPTGDLPFEVTVDLATRAEELMTLLRKLELQMLSSTNRTIM